MSVKFDFDVLGFQGNNVDMELPKNIAQGTINKFIVNEDIVLHKIDMTPRQDFKIENIFENAPLLSFTTFLEGSMNYNSKQFQFKKQFKKNTLNISALNYEDGESYYKKDQKVKAMHLIITPQFIEKNILKNINSYKLEKILDRLYSKPFFELLKEDLYDYSSFETLNTLNKTPFNNGLENLFIQSKIYELLYQWFKAIEKPNLEYISKDDIYYLNILKEYILENLDKNFTLSDFAKIARTNENKLQKIFKGYFGQTVFDFVLNCKMGKAKQLLKTSDYNISEISSLIGYKYQSNFSIAFVKKFGIKPKELMKSRKYYY